MGTKNIYERFVWFDDRVRRNRYPNATSLSKEFEISLKTAQRDIEFMRGRLNCPLEYDKSRKGYYYEDGSFSIPLTYLSADELSSLLLAKRLLQDISGEFIRNELSSVINKISSILKKHVEATEKIDGAFSFKLIEYSPTPDDTFKAVLNACLKRKRLMFTYYSPMADEQRPRTVDPYHMLNYMGTWHLIAYCHKRKAVRDFVLGRISGIHATEKTFKIPAEFNIDEHINTAFGIYKGKSVKQVTLRFSPLKAKWVKGQIWHTDQKERHHKDGSLDLSFPVASFSEIMMEVLKHGSGVEVIKPKTLRDIVKSEAKRIARMY